MLLWLFGVNQLFAIDFFPNKQNQQIANCQVATDTLAAIVKALRQNF